MDSPLKGKLLVAAPQLQDPNFLRTVVLIVTHDENGAMGLVINRPLTMTVAEAWKQVSEIPYENHDPIHQGGPCEGMLMVLHSHEEEGQLEIMPGLWLSTDADSVRRLVDADEQPLKFFVGYAGWTAGQLESEISESAWVMVDATPEQLFDTPEDLWLSLMRGVLRTQTRPNIDPKLLPPDPSVN